MERQQHPVAGCLALLPARQSEHVALTPRLVLVRTDHLAQPDREPAWSQRQGREHETARDPAFARRRARDTSVAVR